MSDWMFFLAGIPFGMFFLAAWAKNTLRLAAQKLQEAERHKEFCELQMGRAQRYRISADAALRQAQSMMARAKTEDQP